MKKRILSATVVLLCISSLFYFADDNAKEESIAPIEPIAEQEQLSRESAEREWYHMFEFDSRLSFIHQISYPYQKAGSASASFGVDESRSGQKIYSEAEIAETPHAIFDEKNRLVYALTLSDTGDMLYEENEENLYDRNDEEHTCRHIYYKSSVCLYDPGYDSCYYVNYQSMREVEYWQFSENGNLISYLQYSPKRVGMPTNRFAKYSPELYLNYGYQVEYDGDYLMSELLCNSYGTWNYHAYQYDDAGNCILEIVVTNAVILSTYEYDDTTKQVTRCSYLVDEDWELPCKDGSIYSFYSGHSERATRPAVRKTAADGTILTELFYEKAYYIRQEPYLIADEIEDTINIHRYMVQPDDSLWSIAEKYYGYGSYGDILYWVNRNVIGQDRDTIQPGIRLYMPEIWTAESGSINYF